MKQLEFNFKSRDCEIPTFDDWYAENSHERRQFGEKAYSKMKAVSVYADLIESGFFYRYKKGGK
tara:strand:+ start:273 stop:464 length:192 start_codon:yes stop_codon:yes gene_type:complete